MHTPFVAYRVGEWKVGTSLIFHYANSYVSRPTTNYAQSVMDKILAEYADQAYESPPQAKWRPSAPCPGFCRNSGRTRSGRRCDEVFKLRWSNCVEGDATAAKLSDGPSARRGG